jgi:hypothetical protein
MRITATIPDHGAVIEAVLEGFVLAAMEMIAAGAVPPYPTGVEFRNESYGSEEWLLPNQVLQRGYGDCEDLAIWYAAGCRVTGDDPGARAVLVQTGPHRLHCVVEHTGGQMQDVALAIATGNSGYALGGTLMIRDNRAAPGKAVNKFAGLPPAAANPNPTRIDDTLDKYMADNHIAKLTIDTDTGIVAGKSGVVMRPPTERQLQQLKRSAADELVRGGQGNFAAAMTGLEHAAAVFDVPKSMDTYGQGVRSTATRVPVVPATDEYGRPVYNADGSPVYVNAQGQATDANGRPIDYDQNYNGMYGLYDQYGTYAQDPFYRGPWGAEPDYPYGGWQDPSVPYGGWQSQGQPMLTYEDVYGEFQPDEPIAPEYGLLPDAQGSYDDE